MSRFVRIQVGYRGRLGVEVGVMVAVDHLRRAGRLTQEQVALYLDVDDWFNVHLPNPPFYDDGNTIRAVTWWKTPVRDDMQERVDTLTSLLSEHQVTYEIVASDDPGTLVYEDDFQVGVVPYRRGTPEAVPYGTGLAPTTAGSKRAVEVSPVRHLLFDADGVLQDVPGGWYAAMEPYLGERARDFLIETWSDEKPFLRGGGDYLPILADGLRRYGVETPVEEVYAAVWHNIEVAEESLEIVRRLRRNGYGVHLGTNQEQHRAAYMRSSLGYETLFDVCCYSCDLGAAKPDPKFFRLAAERIGADPDSILFIDDTAKNVVGAREAGLNAEQWVLTDGHERLQALFTEHGVAV